MSSDPERLRTLADLDSLVWFYRNSLTERGEYCPPPFHAMMRRLMHGTVDELAAETDPV